MSNNAENGGPTPAESQELSNEQLEKLLGTLKNLPFDDLSKLPFEVRNLISAERESVDAERASLNAERKKLQADREKHESEVARHSAELLSQLKLIMDAAQKAHEREASQSIFFAELNNTLARLENASTASKAERIKAHLEVIDRLDSMQEAAALSHNDQMRLSMAISNRLDAIGAQNDHLQTSMDRIGEMMNRLHDFIVSVRDLVKSGQDAIFTFQGDFAEFKKANREFNSSLLKGITKGFDDLNKSFDQMPEKLGLKIQDIKSVYAALVGASKGLIERGNKFAAQQEDYISQISDRIDDLGDLYANHTRRLNSGLEDQLKLAKSSLANGVEDLLGDLKEIFKKSDVHGLLSEIYKMEEQLRHSQTGLTSLLESIQEEKESMADEIQKAKDAFTTNAKDINLSMSSLMDDKQRLMSELRDAMRLVKSLMDEVERMRVDVVKTAGSVVTMSNLATSGALATAEEMMQRFQVLTAQNQIDVLETIKTEGEVTRASILTGYLGGNDQGEV